MKKAAVFALGLYYLFLAASPALIIAQTSRLPAQIVPCAGVQAVGSLPACTCSHLVELVQRIINTGIILVVVGSALLFAYAGFLYLTNEAIGMQQQAKSIFKNVAIGLVIMLAAWLVVDTLMNSLLRKEFGQWNAIQPVDEICQKLGIYDNVIPGGTGAQPY